MVDIKKVFFVFWICLLGSQGQVFGESFCTPDSIFDTHVSQQDTEYGKSSIAIPLSVFHIRHFKLQYAGSIGFFSVGAGIRVGKTYEPSLYYGLLGRDFGGSSVTVHTISLKNSFYLTRKPWFKLFYPKAGLSVNWGNTNNTFKKLPPYYPEKYYFQNMIHIAPFWGGEWKVPINGSFFKGMGLYFEFSALDAYLLEAVRTKYVDIFQIWSLGIGFTFYIP